MGSLVETLPQNPTMARIIASVAMVALASAAPQFHGDSSNAIILQEQRFNAGAGKFGAAYAQEDGVVFREESGGNDERIGQYSYIDDTGKTITVKYSAGINGFRILEGDHIPSGGQNSALAGTVFTTPRPGLIPEPVAPRKSFPPGQIQLDRFPEGFNFNFRSQQG